MYIKLTDFGFATECFDSMQGDMGTPLFKAPELVQNEKHDSKVDIWALGVIAFSLFSGGHHPFVTQDEMEDIDFDDTVCAQLVKTREPNMKKVTCQPEIKSIISQCLKKRPADRPTAS